MRERPQRAVGGCGRGAGVGGRAGARACRQRVRERRRGGKAGEPRASGERARGTRTGGARGDGPRGTEGGVAALHGGEDWDGGKPHVLLSAETDGGARARNCERGSGVPKGPAAWPQESGGQMESVAGSIRNYVSRSL